MNCPADPRLINNLSAPEVDAWTAIRIIGRACTLNFRNRQPEPVIPGIQGYFRVAAALALPGKRRPI